ncbi:hypothetical protein WJX84_004662 [Apatococcus fuscideae]|uniref:Uncharacterized protein n=1 Tax=Apatococcus fuscideae TaxID=2026836 RepID=A0AAW1T2K3_9CHLO
MTVVGKMAIGRDEASAMALAEREAVAQAFDDLVFDRVQAALSPHLPAQQQIVHTEGQRKHDHSCTHLPGGAPEPAESASGLLDWPSPPLALHGHISNSACAREFHV